MPTVHSPRFTDIVHCMLTVCSSHCPLYFRIESLFIITHVDYFKDGVLTSIRRE